MPYIKRQKPHEDISKLIYAEHWTHEELARILGCSRQTASRKTKNPGSLTVDDLTALCTKGHIPIEKIRESLKV